MCLVFFRANCVLRRFIEEEVCDARIVFGRGQAAWVILGHPGAVRGADADGNVEYDLISFGRVLVLDDEFGIRGSFCAAIGRQLAADV